jgi:allophanate hydrolase
MRLTIPALSAAYRSGELTPEHTVAAVLQQMQLHAGNPVWISRCSEESLLARAAELSRIAPDSLPLYGVPFAIKDNIDLAGLPTTAGCPDAAFLPTASAHVVQRLLDAGAIAIGKTNMDQFATGLVGTRSPYGICRNAFDAEYLSGGSSSGSALAVALGMASFALGTDTAGSGRVPAAFNNIIGYKPTLGRLSNRGMLPACRSIDAMSVFALTAADALTVARTAAAFDIDDPWSRRQQLPAGRLWSQRDGLRVAVPAAGQLEFFGNAEYPALYAAAAESLRAQGARLQEVDIAPLLQAARLLYEGPWVAERYLATATLLESKPQCLLPVTRQIIEGGRSGSARDAFAAQYRLRELTAAAQAIWQQADVLLLPTAGTHYRIDAEQAEPLQLNANLGRYTNFVNLMDLAAVAVPAGFTSRGLPFGVTLIAPAWHDEDLLFLAGRMQAAGVRLGATPHQLREEDAAPPLDEKTIDVAVCGAHMQGLPLNGQLTSRGAWRIAVTRTAPCYRLYALPGGPPSRPGLLRVAEDGEAIEVEVWRMPQEHFASFMQGIPAPLGIGRVRLASGAEVAGFLCEASAVQGAADITWLGSWRSWLAQGA